MTREEKKRELVALFTIGAMPIGELIDACFAFADNHHHWISAEDELPKDYESVLAAVGGNHFAFVGICLNKKRGTATFKTSLLKLKVSPTGCRCQHHQFFQIRKTLEKI